MTEVDIAKVQRLPLGRAKAREAAGRYALPIGVWQWYPQVGREAPLVRVNLVQTLVVERNHQVGIHGFAVGILNGQRPLLLLSWCQSVAECGPLQLQFLVGHGSLYLGYVGVALAVLHPSIRQQQAVFVFILIKEPAVYQLVAALYRSLLYQLLAAEYAIYYMYILCRRTHLDGHGCAVVSKHAGRLVEPVIRLNHRLLVIQRENDEVATNRLAFVSTLNRVLTRGER